MIDAILRYYNLFGITKYPFHRKMSSNHIPPDSTIFFELKNGVIGWTKDIDVAKKYHKVFTTIYVTYLKHKVIILNPVFE